MPFAQQGIGGRLWIDLRFDVELSGKFELKHLLCDDAGAVEGVIEPEIGVEWMMSCGRDDAVFEEIAWLEAEDADGFYADVLVGGRVDYGGIGVVGDGAGENVGYAAVGMSDADLRNFDFFEAAVVVEIEAGELADAEFGIDFDDAVDFFAGVTVGLEGDFGFEEIDLGWGLGFGGREWRLSGLLGLGGGGEEEQEKQRIA